MSFNRSREEFGYTLSYTAPELFSEGSYSSKETDMYGFGKVVYAVITGGKFSQESDRINHIQVSRTHCGNY